MTELLLAWNWPGLGPLARGPLAWPWPLAYSICLNLAWPLALGPWPGPGPGLQYLFINTREFLRTGVLKSSFLEHRTMGQVPYEEYSKV